MILRVVKMVTLHGIYEGIRTPTSETGPQAVFKVLGLKGTVLTRRVLWNFN